MEKMNGEGVWVLAEASPSMQLYVKKHHPESYEKEILRYMTPQKYIKRGNEIIIVSLTEQIWGGIRVFKEEDIVFNEFNGTIHTLQNKKRAKVIVSAVDFQESVGERTFEEGNIEIKMKECRTKEEFRKAMLASGYLTEEEYKYYSNPENFKDMTTIKTVNF